MAANRVKGTEKSTHVCDINIRLYRCQYIVRDTPREEEAVLAETHVHDEVDDLGEEVPRGVVDDEVGVGVVALEEAPTGLHGVLGVEGLVAPAVVIYAPLIVLDLHEEK
jgi:hypothetical protein